MKRLLNLMLIVLLGCALVLSACGKKNTNTQTSEGGSKNDKKLKVALLLPGTINDNGWNAKAYTGIKMIEEELGAEVFYIEKVSQSDQEEVFRNYAAEGFNILIGHGFQFGDAAKRVAKDFPNVKFLITSTDISQEPNLASTNTSPEQMGFLEGVVAGLATKKNNIGIVGGQEIPPIISAVQGFEAGIKYINPNAEINITMTGDFDDAVKAKEAAKALIDKGADVVILDADHAGLGVIEACKEKGVYAVSSVSVQHELAPDTVLGSGTFGIPKAMKAAVKHVIDGDFKAQFYSMGIKEDSVSFVPNPKFQNIYKEKLEQVIEDIKSGKIDVEALIEKK